MTGPYSLTVNGNITSGSIASSGPTVLNGAVSGAGIINLLNLYCTKSSPDLQCVLKTDVALVQSVVNGSTTQTNYYFLNTGISGLYVRNGTNLIAQFATDGTTYISNNSNRAGSIAGYALTQINTLIYNAIGTLQDNATITTLTILGTSTMQAGLSVMGALGLTGTLTVSGCVTMPGYMWAAGLISDAGTKMTGTGFSSWSVSRSTAGTYIITFGTAHPLGANYIVTVSGQATIPIVRSAVPTTSTSFQVSSYTNGTSTLIDGMFSFMVLAS